MQDFETVVMGADELRSFYITLKGPFLDTFAAAMDERGFLDRDFEAFRLDVGGGLSEYKFPIAFDEIVFPKFAGVIHYQESTDCVSPPETMITDLKFDFLFDIYEFDEATFKKVADVVKAMLEDELAMPDGLLTDAVAQHGLLLVGDPISALPSQPLRKCDTSNHVHAVLCMHCWTKTHTQYFPSELSRTVSVLQWRYSICHDEACGIIGQCQCPVPTIRIGRQSGKLCCQPIGEQSNLRWKK